YGLDAYRLQPPDWIWARRVVWALSGIGATLCIGILALTWALPDKGFAQEPSTRTALAALLLAALLQAWRRDRFRTEIRNPKSEILARAAGVLLTLLMCFEISGVTGSLFRDLRRPGYFVDRMEE